MDTAAHTPLVLFNHPQRLVVPLFQRAYVWDLAEQWIPLWRDITTIADRFVNGQMRSKPHFLGAVVLQQQLSTVGSMSTWTIIDGQQRMTTLQLLFDAVASALTEAGFELLRQRLELLTTNPVAFCTEPDDRFKVWPTNRDRAAFREVLSAEVPVEHSTLALKDSQIVKAHAFFVSQAGDWLTDEGDARLRAEALVNALTDGLQLVVITLGHEEDSQEIFETLNARGTPLTAADLIKNFVFQKLSQEGADTELAYRSDWQFFESDFWETSVSVGRVSMARSSLFLNQWLIAQTAEEISPRATFARFKRFVEHENREKMSELLPRIKRQAQMYRGWVERASQADAHLSTVELAVYRTQAIGSELIKPLLISLHDDHVNVPESARHRAIAAVESWLVRRSLLRLTSSDLGRIVAELVRIVQTVDAPDVGQSVEALLARLDSASTYWPGDAEIREDLKALPAYSRFKRAKLRMILQAVEDHGRGFTRDGGVKTGSRALRGDNLHIEHLLPQSWRASWPIADAEEGIHRESRVNRLGNLTLLTGALNTSISNGPWLGEKGKLAQLAAHDVLLMNQWVRHNGSAGWDEGLIDRRTLLVIDALLDTWVVPAGHTGEIRVRKPDSESVVEIEDLVKAGLLSVGDSLTPRSGSSSGELGFVGESGTIRVGDDSFESPSAAAKRVRGGSTNGWKFWSLADGRRLGDVREQYRSALVMAPAPATPPV
ncbi:GmrSD restriction endonuclease domain-containing protein [Sanguibacter antarcticus]|uniref:Uncharacterized protein DUF4357 n=1 Tax=Sanguibacter antarcticus TaxID=372484 RepID=A0A2A9E6Z8_9MICO|nr:DUF262 domain-containing protein [Sanguibacter antarcticus]PFG34624.1 uncharacterized protein DUF4357 [Sanguibacter antarcticus]